MKRKEMWTITELVRILIPVGITVIDCLFLFLFLTWAKSLNVQKLRDEQFLWNRN